METLVDRKLAALLRSGGKGGRLFIGYSLMENVSETEYTIILHVLSLGDRGAHKNVRSEFRLHPRIAASEASIFFF